MVGASHAIVVPQTGGTWAAVWGEAEDDPAYIAVATISDFQSPHRLVLSDYRYHAKAGPLPFDADFMPEFLVSKQAEGTSLRVTQDGFPAGPEGDEFYAGCQQGWQDTFAGIRQYLDETSDSA
jgi:uncharacterized protein YndB with AHSA1/START domain